jgi:lactoylglutathione lyase
VSPVQVTVPTDFPAPSEGFVVTHFLVVSDQDRSRGWYEKVLGATTLLERDPVIMKVANSWLILNNGGGPTDDKPDTVLAVPEEGRPVSAFLNLRVADIAACYDQWRDAGATFLTEPKDHGQEIRAYMRDPDGHIIEVGQATGVLDRR